MDCAALVALLLDDSAPVADRDDAAIDLAECDTAEAEAALLALGSRGDAPYVLAASCGESLAEIWMRRGAVRQGAVDALAPVARLEATARLTVRLNGHGASVPEA